MKIVRTPEEKQLLFKDLSARLPYYVRLKIWLKDGTTEEGFLDLEHNYVDVLRDAFYYNKIIDIKPYLRPLSSMTKEELYEVQEILGKGVEIREDFIVSVDSSINSFTYLELIAVFEWLLKKHFDFMGLIPKGLAIEVTEENNPYKD